MSSCPVCGSRDPQLLLRLDELPVFCNIQYPDADTARRQPTGSIELHYCGNCQHFFNAAFDPKLVQYGEQYENSLHYSATFSGFARELVADLLARHDLHGAQVVDIGCGKGDFLRLLAELGEVEGHGFDPSYEPDRESAALPDNLHFHARVFGPAESALNPQLVSCRQVLEHIWTPVEFLSDIAGALPADPRRLYYLEVPNALYTVRDLGIWDLIYEHCQYFSPASLADCARRAGLQAESLTETFGAQYLALEGRLEARAGGGGSLPDRSGSDADAAARTFPRRAGELLERWRERLVRLTANGPAVIWGAGSKGVTFANLVGQGERVAALVDINPHKQDRYIAGSGHRIVGPEAVPGLDPAVVLVMNPLYTTEITGRLRALGVKAPVEGVA